MAEQKLCVVDGCGKPVHGRGLCGTHYVRQRRSAELSLCSIPDCGKPVIARGFCAAHHTRWLRWGDPLISKKAHGVHPVWLEAHKCYRGDDCLIWPFPRNEKGYGQTYYFGKKMSPARAMCIMAHGAPPVGKEVAHSCGNGHLGCVTPRHIRWATKQENEDDKQKHSRIQRGEKHYAAKLSESDVRQIRSLAAEGTTQDVIAGRFGVRRETIKDIVRRRIWAWLE